MAVRGGGQEGRNVWDTLDKLDWENYARNELEAPTGSSAELDVRGNPGQYDVFVEWESPEGETGEDYLMSLDATGYVWEIKPDIEPYFGRS